MKKIKQLAYVLLAGSVMAVSCQGEDGAVGPQGTQGDQGQQGPQGSPGMSSTQKDGFIKGTISGKRKDGTAFQESFENNYRYYAEGFRKESGLDKLSLFRSGEAASSNAIHFDLLVHNKGTSTQQVQIRDYYMDFLKKLSNNEAFAVNVEALFKDLTVVYPIAPTNTTYDFDFVFQSYGGEVSYEYIYDQTTGKRYYGFKTVGGNLVVFNNPAYNSSTGQEVGSFAYVQKADGTKLTSTDPITLKYNSLKLSFNNNSRFIMLDFQDNSLAESKVIPADTYTITNYKYDSATGALTFDYTLNIAGTARRNTSNHPITITGSVSSTVYDVIVNKANGGTAL